MTRKDYRAMRQLELDMLEDQWFMDRPFLSPETLSSMRKDYIRWMRRGAKTFKIRGIVWMVKDQKWAVIRIQARRLALSPEVIVPVNRRQVLGYNACHTTMKREERVPKKPLV